LEIIFEADRHHKEEARHRKKEDDCAVVHVGSSICQDKRNINKGRKKGMPQNTIISSPPTCQRRQTFHQFAYISKACQTHLIFQKVELCGYYKPYMSSRQRRKTQNKKYNMASENNSEQSLWGDKNDSA
jgi:hypothetical protein